MVCELWNDPMGGESLRDRERERGANWRKKDWRRIGVEMNRDGKRNERVCVTKKLMICR